MLPSVFTEFTPIASLLGGVLIGSSALLVLLLFGRVAGISGITTAGLITRSSDWMWRVAFIVGLVSAPVLMSMIGMEKWGMDLLRSSPVSGHILGMGLAGLLVGIGTVVGSGCTSGHGVCGLGRMSLRSLVAVIIFMGSAVITVAVLRHVL